MTRKILTLLLIIATTSVWADESTSAYTDHSVLCSGSWAKIQVSGTGIHRLTGDVIRKAGFSDLSKVKIYGYGGAVIPERLTQEYLREHDDLKEIPTCTIGDAKYFMAQGSISWSDQSTTQRTRNPYYDYGCYFITQTEGTPLTTTEDELLEQQKQDFSSFHFLHEKDQYAWYQIGRNLVEKTSIAPGTSKNYEITIPKGNTTADFRIVITTASTANFTIKVGNNFEASSTMNTTSEYDKAVFRTITGTISKEDIEAATVNDDGDYVVPVSISCSLNGPIRLDYIAASFSTPKEPEKLSTSYPAAEYVYNITNQDHHADDPVDMLIIIPTSQHTLTQAEELADVHRAVDGLTVRIIPADELYNEFSSGTPDISAYRRYLKMFYDKDDSNDKSHSIKSCLLFGDCVWDNRMLTLSGATYNPDNYLLGYMTENSYNTMNSIVSDDFIGILQDDKKIHADGDYDRDMSIDVAVGRFPVSNATQAQAMVNKVAYYMQTSPNGVWQNEIMFIGDDSDNNSHMRNINANADAVRKNSPGYNVKKVMFDAYEKISTSTGDRYPEIEEIVRKQQKDGALIINYGGHASATDLAHEKMLLLADFNNFRGTNFPLWFTAACTTMPFQTTESNIGKAAVLNADGGAVAFVGTVGTVLEELNSRLDKYFMRHVLSYDKDGEPISIGEALRLAKNNLIANLDPSIGSDNSINKHHYQLLGDPAMHLAIPTYNAVIDNINDMAVTSDDDEETITLKGSGIVTIEGHVEDKSGNLAEFFNGTANITVKDSKQTIVCRGQAEASSVFSYSDYSNNLFVGTCNVVDGEFSISFRMPRDISNDGGNGLITVYARDKESMVSANGETTQFKVEGWEEVTSDGVGPAIYAYLNNPSFANGGDVGGTPYFVAEITDKDGINITGNGIGHNLELIVDGDADMTYDLNDNFVFDENSYTSGQTYYILPTLSAGYHTLTFRAWDLMNNSSTVTMNFRVTKNIQPTINDISVSPNPITNSATFYITHDMQGSPADIYIDIIDMSGRIVETLYWTGTLSETSNTSACRWTPSGVSRGIYLYRVRLSTNGGKYVSKTKKLIIAK